MSSIQSILRIGGLTAALLVSAAGLRAASATSPAEDWLNHYYQKPTPSQFAPALLELSRSGYLDQPGHVSLAIGFVASVFAQNPARVAEWMALRSELPPAHQRLLVAALWYSGNPKGRDFLRADARNCEPEIRAEITALLDRKPALADSEVRSASSLNLQWGVFLATGESAPVRNILAALGSSDNAQLNQDVRWSLAQNAVRHERVLTICRDELSRQPNAVRETLRAVINDTESHRPSSS